MIFSQIDFPSWPPCRTILTRSAPRRTIPSCQSGPRALPDSVVLEPCPRAFLSGIKHTNTHVKQENDDLGNFTWHLNKDVDLLWRSGTLQVLVPLWCSEVSYREQLVLVCQPPETGWRIAPPRGQRRCFLWPCPSQPRSPRSPGPQTYTGHVQRHWLNRQCEQSLNMEVNVYFFLAEIPV